MVASPSVTDLNLSKVTTDFKIDNHGLAKTINNKLLVGLQALSSMSLHCQPVGGAELAKRIICHPIK